MSQINTLQKNIKRRNLLATALIVILVSCSFLSLMVIFSQQEKGAEIINIAGSQRMLSQKIALFSYQHYHNIVNSSIDSGTKNTLFEAANTFENNQKLLTKYSINKPNIIPQQVHSLLLNSPTKLNEKVDRYTESAILLSQTKDKDVASQIIKQQLSLKSIDNLLFDLDNVVSTLENHFEQRVAYIQIFETILWLATMGLIGAVSFFIYRPLKRIITDNYDELIFAKKRSVELKLAINKHAIVYRVLMNDKGTITEVNQRFSEFYLYTEQEIIGRSVFNICSKDYTEKFYEEVFKTCISNEYWHGESINKIKGGRELWLSTTIVPIITGKKIESFIVIQNDISGIKQTELALNQLHKITSDVKKDFSEKIENILVLGKQIFNLPLGLISEVNGEEYRILYCNTPNNEISPGALFELGNTYCSHTLKADKAIAFHQASNSEIKDHPCYSAFRLESYIGVPLVVDGKPFGTLNFSGSEPSSRPFTDRELDLLQLFAHWVSAELSRANHISKLFAQQSLMEEMAQQARIGAWEVNMVNNTIFWSEMTKEIHEVSSDYQPELSTAINFYKAGKSRDTIETLVAQSIEDGTDYEQELQLVTAKGNEVWVAVRGRSEFENGHCVRLFGSFQDVTEKMITQNNISVHSQRMTLATDSAGIGIWELNLITKEIKWDDWMFKLYGVEPDKFSGAYEAWEDGLHPEDKAMATDTLKQAIEKKGKFHMQFRIVWPNGEIRHLKAAAIISCDSEQNPISMIGVNYDVTELVENEIALIKAKEQAEIAVKAKSEFFASMSHEIRTPMNGVIGMLDLVKESPLNQEQKHRIGIAQQSAKSLLSLINDILDFSKIDANKLELENVSFDIRKMVGDLGEAFAQQAQHKNLELILDLVGVEESLVKGDSNRIRQILTNLVGNAIKFTKEGEVIVRLTQQEYADNQWLIVVEVSDTGIGISNDKLNDLFEAFSQVDASTTREYGGTGLGLAIVKKLCLCMNGSVKVESIKGQGSRFICELFLDKSEDSLLSISPPKSEGKRVLIIEDNQSCAETLKRQLACWRVDAEIVKNMELALAELTKDVENPRYHLVLMSRQNGDEKSLDFVRTVRTYPSLVKLNIIFMTLMANQNDLVDSTEIGLTGYFPKPVTTSDLHYALNTLVGDSLTKRVTDIVSKKEIHTASSISWMKEVKLLLVEDNRVNQMVALGVLKKIGIERCEIAQNGRDAIEKLRLSDSEEPFTFIFMDCQMPVMDGYQATTLIRNGDAGTRYNNIPIVAMTANAMVGDEQKCLASGMNDYLAKPINKLQIQDTLVTFLSDTH